jgi:homoserine kinase
MMRRLTMMDVQGADEKFPGDWIGVFAPGTVGNLGPGFDVLGLALNGIGDEIRVRRTSERVVRIAAVSGVDSPLPTDPLRNTASIAARYVLDTFSTGNSGLEMVIHKGLPISSGLGGSAASACGGALAAAEAMGLALDKRQLIEAALQGEVAVAGRHVDNIAPCIYGGITMVHDAETLDIISLPVPESLRIVIAMPPEKLNTREARAILKREIDLPTAVMQWAHMGALISALYEKKLTRLRDATVDLVAEPLRMPLLTYGRELKTAALEAGAYGSSISGAGPAIFAFADVDNASIVRKAMEDVFHRRGVSGKVYIFEVDTRGTRRIT